MSLLLAFPKVLEEIGLWLTFSILVITFFVTVATRVPVVKKVTYGFWDKRVVRPVSEWQAQTIKEVHEPFQEYVKHHLGPNGTTPPVHERLKNLEQRSAVGELRQRRFMDNIEVLVAESGPDGMCNFVNLALCELLECDPEDWYGEGWKNFIEPSMLAAEVSRWDAVQRNQSTNPFHLMILTSKKSRTKISVKGRSYPIKASGELIGWVGEMHRLNPNDPSDAEFLREADGVL